MSSSSSSYHLICPSNYPRLWRSLAMRLNLFSCFTLALSVLCLSPLCSPYPYGYGYGPLPDVPSTSNQLDYHFYDNSCPQLQIIVSNGVYRAYQGDSRMPASLLRLHFHDCFVNGCDASILLDDMGDLKGEKNALPNRNSARGYQVIDSIKAEVEKACPSTASCADILAIAARAAVSMVGGPFWPVLLGRRDGTTASEQGANTDLPSPLEPLENITTKFEAKGLDLKDVAVLSGAHTIGFAQCFTFKRRLFDFKGSGKPDPTLVASMLTNLQGTCPNLDSSNTNLSPLDTASSVKFDNLYYKNIANNAGLLESDQALLGDPKTAALVNAYTANQFLFFSDFAASMVKLGNIGVLTGKDGQIRKKCSAVN